MLANSPVNKSIALQHGLFDVVSFTISGSLLVTRHADVARGCSSRCDAIYIEHPGTAVAAPGQLGIMRSCRWYHREPSSVASIQVVDNVQ